MHQDPNPMALGLIIIGTFFSLGREYLAKLYLRMYGWIRKKEIDERLLRGVKAYLMLTGMIFTIAGLLGLFGIVSW